MKKIFKFFLIILFSFNCYATTTDYIKSNANEIKGTNVPQTLIDSFQGMKLVLLGESHGTNELPDYASAIIEQASNSYPIAVGLEFPSDIQNSIDQFLSSGDETILKKTLFFQNENYNSGRGSEAMVRLLKKIRQLGIVKIFCFDIPYNFNMSERDTAMARNVLNFINNNPLVTVITFSGNIHSRLTIGYPSNPNHKNMGSEIIRLSQGNITLKNATNILFRYDEGTAWQCWMNSIGKIDCGEKRFGSINTPYARAVDFDRYYLKEPEMTDGHQASLFIRKITESIPLK